jgi:hypothetical protein
MVRRSFLDNLIRDSRAAQTTHTLFEAAVQPSIPPVDTNRNDEDQFCVPSVSTGGDSIRLTQATRGKGVKPLAD